MSSRHASASVDVVANVKAYQEAFAKLPGVTDQAAFKAAQNLEKRLTKAQEVAANEAKRAAERAAQAWEFAIADNLLGLGRDIGAGLVEVGRDVLALEGHLHRMSMETGFAVETLSALRSASVLGGSDFDDLIDSFRDFGEVAFEFDRGGGRAADAMAGLQIETRNQDGTQRSLNDVFVDTITRLSEMEEGSTKVAYAQQLASDQGAELARVLSGNEFDDYLAFAREFGATAGPEAAAAQAQWTAATGSFRLAIEDVVTQYAHMFGQDSAGQIVQRFSVGLVAVSSFFHAWAGGFLDDMKQAGESGWELLTTPFGELSGATGRFLEDLREAYSLSDELMEALAEAQRRGKIFAAGTGGSTPGGGMTPQGPQRVGAGAGSPAPARPAGVAGGGAGAAAAETPLFDAAAGQAWVQASQELAREVEQMQLAQLEGADAVNARYDAQLDRLQALAEATGNYSLALDGALLVEQSRRSEVLELLDQETQRRAEMHVQEMAQIQERQAAEDAAALARASRDQAMLQGFVSNVAGSTAAIAGMFDASTQSGKEAAQTVMAISRAAAVFDVLLKFQQASANALAQGGPFAGVAMLGLVAGLFAPIIAAVGKPPPRAHTGTWGSGPMGDEYDTGQHRVLKSEVVLPPDLVSRLGGPDNVRSRLETQQPIIVMPVIDINDDRILGRIATGVAYRTGAAAGVPLGWGPS